MFGNVAVRSGRDRFNLVVFAAFVLVLALFGGASRADAIGQGVVRLAALAVIVVCAGQITAAGARTLKAPALLVASLALLMIVQLIPLPFGLWAELPGHAPFAEMAARGGLAPVWRPLSLTPDRTLNALLALLPPAAAITLLIAIPRNLHAKLLTGMLVVIGINVVIGILQVGSGEPYLYQVTNRGSAVGIFANRNHSALFVALALPLLAGWFVLHRGTGEAARSRHAWIALCGVILVFPVLLVTGSRGGLLLGACGLAGGIAIALMATQGSERKAVKVFAAISAALLVALVAVFALFSRAEALQRLVAADQRELRFDVLPTLLRMVRDFFPVGSGFGSFDPLYRLYEIRANLGPYYLNQAHDDWVQFVLEGGAAALLIVLCGGVWYISRTINVWRRSPSPSVVLGRTASVALAMILIGSLFDYPLRTSTMAVSFIVAIAWLCEDKLADKRSVAKGRSEGERGELSGASD